MNTNGTAGSTEESKAMIKKKGDMASKWEKHWLWCMEQPGGRYQHPMKGPFAEEFADDYSAGELGPRRYSSEFKKERVDVRQWK